VHSRATADVRRRVIDEILRFERDART